MPTNEQRRATAKRKLERQLERRAHKARRRRLITIASSIAAAVLLVAAGVFAVYQTTGDSDDTANTAASTPPDADNPDQAGNDGALPPFTPSDATAVTCDYPSSGTAAKKVNPPKTQDGKVPTDAATVSVSMMTDQGPVGLLLDNAKAPCTVNSFLSLADQGFFDDTPCHRLTTSPLMGVLQCGDPTGSGKGGPGYSFADEYPTNVYAPGDPALERPVTYPRGTLAMANSGPNTNGSQFFLVYRDSQLAPNFTVFGTIQEDGLATLDKIADAGVADGTTDGAPTTPVTIKSVLLD
ncbi:peptidylprolyl isomerase [Mycobacterium koreense]|uniref:Peptidyl-prolyl cis-trans isomerase n=1 Tax=Mycolicibacillus koreensis TaxID=1069220 RepID=A0A7I7SCX5_9MYCO|nr:peptidylprolyl isomerase [Mycolicibacillus koreensis]MCV7247499.1 peptidylprolyl isomerase [Mycolicibacillus koreensis]OSC34558.1 peptidylprolyl isomerase [Mycolicibacillus koreensis]BBY53875.1 peptidyl-prolyl cis-trans isomerase [Mycolicibacillus koreensis]